MDYPRRELIEHVASGRNLCLLVSRQTGATTDWRHVFVTDKPANDCVTSDESSEANQVFPLWRFDDESARENLSPDFRAFLDARYAQHYSPEEILGYIYAVLHAPTYRARYAEFLRIDFPRIPFPEDAEAFEALARLGWGLVEAHLLRDSLPRSGLARYPGRGDDRVEAVRYAPAEEAVWINATQSFRPVPAAVWEFRIGGYQVLDKYLKSRKGRRLSLDEIGHVARVADALAFTSERMAAIDEVYRAAFPQQVGVAGA